MGTCYIERKKQKHIAYMSMLLNTALIGTF